MNKVFPVLALVFALVFGWSRAQTVVPAEMQTLTKAWAETINKGDLEAWLKLHAENVDYADYSWWVGKSRAEMRKWGEAVISAKGAFKITSSRMEGRNLVWLLEYRDSGFSNKSQAVVTVQNGLISKLVIGSRP
jgi:hypothetical protein